jgi:hypothetical protein
MRSSAPGCRGVSVCYNVTCRRSGGGTFFPHQPALRAPNGLCLRLLGGTRQLDCCVSTGETSGVGATYGSEHPNAWWSDTMAVSSRTREVSGGASAA